VFVRNFYYDYLRNVRRGLGMRPSDVSYVMLREKGRRSTGRSWSSLTAWL